MATAGEVTHPHTDVGDVEKVVSTTDNESVSPGVVQKLDGKMLKHSHDADAAMKAFEGMDGQVIELTPEKSKALLRKIDLHLMPIMCIIYGLNYLDKTTLSYASIMGLRHAPSSNKLESGINLTGDQYQWLGSLFYFGYIAWEYPTTRLL